jgi:alkanesulfonate monooxygenase SsuD/methylene tetrahydromethanopterin reductase-like flavin-dependent oxidoreductase (luciferase family)
VTDAPLHLALALEGAGWHPAAWREPDAEPHRLFDPRRWVEVVAEAERVLGRLDAVLLAARIGPRTSRIGLVPTATVTHTEPFHVSKSLATLDYVTKGRAGWQVKVSGTDAEARHFGRRPAPGLRLDAPDDPRAAAVTADLFDEALDAVEVVRRLWDSWEDDAIIRDVPTGRFIDRDRLHYVDFAGRFFSVKGPSTVPRPPQGQPLVSSLGHGPVPYRLAARGGDLLFVTPHDDDGLRSILGQVREEEATVVRDAPLRVFADLVVALDADGDAARDRLAALDERAGGEGYRGDALVFAGSPQELADRLLAWSALGLDGFRLRPAAIPHDVAAVTRLLVPELQRRDRFRTGYRESTLRARLGLARPANRYARAREAS